MKISVNIRRFCQLMSTIKDIKNLSPIFSFYFIEKIDGETNTFLMLPWKHLKVFEIGFLCFLYKSKWENSKFLHPYQYLCIIHFMYECMTPVAMITSLRQRNRNFWKLKGDFDIYAQFLNLENYNKVFCLNL